MQAHATVTPYSKFICYNVTTGYPSQQGAHKCNCCVYKPWKYVYTPCVYTPWKYDVKVRVMDDTVHLVSLVWEAKGVKSSYSVHLHK